MYPGSHRVLIPDNCHMLVLFFCLKRSVIILFPNSILLYWYLLQEAKESEKPQLFHVPTYI